MKRFLFCLFLLFLTVCAAGQDRYKLHRVEGTVFYKSADSSDWALATLRRELSLHDVFDIPPYGSVSIMNVADGMVFTSENHGKINVKQIIDVADEKSGRIASFVKKYIIKSLTEKQVSEMQYGMAGVEAQRSAFFDPKVETLDKDISDILCIASDALNDELVPVDLPIILTRINNNDDTFHFIIRNDTEQPFYVNLLAVTESKVGLCFDPVDKESYNNVLPPKDELNLSQYVFADTGEECRYVLLVSMTDFDVYKVRSKLRNGVESMPEKLSGTVVAVPE